MEHTTGQLTIQGYNNPCIVFHINSEFWYLLRLYQHDTLVYQYIGFDKEIEINTAEEAYGKQPFDTSDITYTCVELKTFSKPDISVEITEQNSLNNRLTDHALLNEIIVPVEEQARYYRGDLHAHTCLTDGSLTPEALVKHAQELNLDFFFITDHNFYHTQWPVSDMLVMPGIEYTANKGHWNALNVKTNYDMYGTDYHIETIEGTHALMDAHRQERTLISINHPFLTIWSWLHDQLQLDKIDCIEIWNDPTYTDNPKAADDALKFWHQTLIAGHRITAVGGSDFHHLIDHKDNNRPNALNDPTTHVFSDKLEPQALLDHIKQGNVFVTRKLDIQDIIVRINDETLLFGQHYTGNKEVTVELTFNQPVYSEVSLWTKAMQLTQLVEQQTVQFNLTLADEDFIRFEIRHEQELLAFTNPIYYNDIARTAETFGEVKEMMI